MKIGKIGVRLGAWALMAVLGGVLLPVTQVLAQQEQEVVQPANRIEKLVAAEQDGNIILKLTLAQPLAAVPASFSVASPARIAFDFPDMANGLGRNSQTLNTGELRSANIVQVGDRTRLVLNLTRVFPHQTRIEGRELLITLAAGPLREAATGLSRTSQSSQFAPAAAPGQPEQHLIRDINFRRGKDGEGRLVVDLSDSSAGIDIRQQGSSLIVDFLKTDVPEQFRRRLDVVDFGTPVSTVLTQTQGGNVRMTITPRGNWEHYAYQTDNQFVLEVKAVKEDPNKLVQGAGKGKFGGEKLSLNFQSIDVRAVLQVIADFTNFNIITSDSVQGNLTLRLKDVPWDQALDIILQARGLDMRKNGNVIWIAPRDELAAREKLDLESRAQIGDLEPLRTESFQINYHKARNVAEFLKGKEQTILSKRGSVSVDERSNKIFVNDVASRLEDVRRMVSEVDVETRQVLIEAQIVEATDTFSRNLGVRLGFGAKTGGQLGTRADGVQIYRNTFGTGNLNSTGYQAGQITNQASFADSLGVNLPASSINNKSAAGAFSFALWNSAGTRFIDLEVSALEADGRGKVVSRPRVLTADKAEALIEQGSEIPYQTLTGSATNPTVSFKKANLALKVKPQITPDGKVMMSIEVNKDQPRYDQPVAGGNVPIDTKHVKTEVVVDNGGTVVIGGIYIQEVGNNTTKVPLLGDIPVVGWLFRNNERKDNKTELLVFITPRIINDQLGLR
ncbi:type IV pilus secretin PilQ [Zoogloea sp.]|uniref:type IV pilus secretin PilQ n=1 Tax=Zoogloea sp. TaxID=49181 RepID=UPI00260441F0|nr:type IV pilus secretin PilQ [Zoogloea sp.]MDD3355107.1 type IV pilus secretin PilQ [Zoogloea sp.]